MRVAWLHSTWYKQAHGRVEDVANRKKIKQVAIFVRELLSPLVRSAATLKVFAFMDFSVLSAVWGKSRKVFHIIQMPFCSRIAMTQYSNKCFINIDRSQDLESVSASNHLDTQAWAALNCMIFHFPSYFYFIFFLQHRIFYSFFTLVAQKFRIAHIPCSPKITVSTTLYLSNGAIEICLRITYYVTEYASQFTCCTPNRTK